MWMAFNLNYNSNANLLFPLFLSSPHTISSTSSGSISWFSFGSISSVMVIKLSVRLSLRLKVLFSS